MPIIKDKKLKERQNNYWKPVKGSWERFKSSWENNINPIKGVLDAGLLSVIPGLNVGQAIYDGSKLLSNDGIRKTYNHLKNKEYRKAALSGAGDLYTIITAIPGGNVVKNSDITKKIAKEATENVNTASNRINDRLTGVEDYIRWKQNPTSIYYNSPSYVDKNKSVSVSSENFEGIRDYKNTRIEGKTKDTQTKVYARKTKDKQGNPTFSTFASIEKYSPNTLNIHLSNPGSTYPAIKLATESPAGTYIGDITFTPNKERSKNFTIGQKLINADLNKDPLGFIKTLFGSSSKDVPFNYSTDSYPIILQSTSKFPNSELRYLEGVYSPLNNRGNATFIGELDLEGKSLSERLKLINKFIHSKNPKARKAIVRDGEILFPHPLIYKK